MVRSVSVRQGLKWKQLQSLVGTRAAIGGVQQIARAHDMARRAQLTAQQAGAVLEVEYAYQASELLGAVPYWQQGDMELYTEDNLERRLRLRSDEAVLEVLQDWWSTAQRSMRSENPWNKGTGLGREDYVRICVKIYKAMIKEFDEGEALECAQDDWCNDSKGEEELTRERFMDAMFELADVWTKTIDAAEYAEFLRTLFSHVSQRSEDGSYYFWKADKDIEYGGYVLEEEEEEPPPPPPDPEPEPEPTPPAPAPPAAKPKAEPPPPKPKKEKEPPPPPPPPPPKPKPKPKPRAQPPPPPPPPPPEKFERPKLPPVEPPVKRHSPPKPTVPRKKPPPQPAQFMDWGSEPDPATNYRPTALGDHWKGAGAGGDVGARYSALDWGEREVEEEAWAGLPEQQPIYVKRKLNVASRLAPIDFGAGRKPGANASSWQQLRSRFVERPDEARKHWDSALGGSASSPALLQPAAAAAASDSTEDGDATDAAAEPPAAAPPAPELPAPAPATSSPPPALPARQPRVQQSPPSPPNLNSMAPELHVPGSKPRVNRAPRGNAAVTYVEGKMKQPRGRVGGSPPQRNAPRQMNAALGDFNAMRVR